MDKQIMGNNKTLTIITSHYNDIEGLIKTWKSIKSQISNSWEWIIVDSYSYDFYASIPKEITNNKLIRIFQINSSIYDAMNYGILKTRTKYFHFLNCNSTYCSTNTLKTILFIIESEKNFNRYLFSFKMLIVDGKKLLYEQVPSKIFFPFKSGHESVIYPTCFKDKIMISSHKGVVADMIFMFEYSLKYKLKCYDLDFLIYPKGGFSDLEINSNDKLRGYIIILILSFSKFKLCSAFMAFYRFMAELKRKVIK
ncbi:glycosyltransferase [Prochlorococcus sp. AH-716-E17]|nr:glycosyltransferase [Prochlorococcus sp. AH-716-E17]